MGSNEKTGTLDEKPKSIQDMIREKRAEKKRLEDEDRLPTYDYPESRGARADTTSRTRKPRTCLHDNPGPEYYLPPLSDGPKFSLSDRIPFSGCMWVAKGVPIRDGDKKVTSLPVDTIDGWRSLDVQSEYQYMYNPTSLSATKVKKKCSAKEKNHPADSSDSHTRYTVVNRSWLGCIHSDTTYYT